MTGRQANVTLNTDASSPETYLTQNLSGVYAGKDPRNYELSSYSYLILPTKIGDVAIVSGIDEQLVLDSIREALPQ